MRHALVLTLAATLAGQQAPVFKSRVDLVALDVTVVDKDGKPVTGLKAGDFTVTINGKPGVVRELDFLTFGAPPTSEVAVAVREVSNTAPSAATASRGGRVIVLLIDDLSARPGQGKGLLVAAERILDTLDLGDMVGLATSSGLGPAVSPTRDRAAVLATLKSKGVVGRKEDVTAPFYLAVDEALLIERDVDRSAINEIIGRECALIDLGPACPDLVTGTARRLARDTVHRAAMQLRAYADVILALKPAPSPRVVIALSTGVAPDADGDYLALEPVSRAAVEAGVQFYALTEVADAIDLSVPDDGRAGGPMYNRTAARRRENGFLTSGVQVVAAAAGGEAFRVVGQADRFFRRIVSETSGIYRLGVEAPLPAGTTRFLDVKVSVKPSGVTVRANRHALTPSASAAPIDVDAALRARVASGGVAFGVPIALATSIRRDPTGAKGLQLGVNVQMPASVASPLVAMFALVDATGKVVNAGRQPVSAAPAGEDYQLAFPIALATGAYRLRFAVADPAGNIGSVEQPVDARLAHLGAVAVSDLVTTWIGTDGNRRLLALETLPDAATTLRVFLELYPDKPDGSAASLRVRLALLRTGDTTPLEEHDLTPAPDGLALSAGVDLAVDALAPGSYIIRATVTESGVVTGTVTTSIRKAG